jgi:hypothetical protein
VVSELDACNLRAVDSKHVSNICNPTLFRSQEKLIIDSFATAVCFRAPNVVPVRD